MSKIKSCAYYCLIACMLFGIAFIRNRHNLAGTIVSDTEGYYMYLPAVLVHQDIHHIPQRTMNARTNEKGELVIKYTYGTALFYLPFFLAAHVYAHLFHYDTSGFSTPYYYGIMLCGVFWATIAIALLSQLLRRHFNTRVSIITVIIIVCGTNFFFYSTKWMGMSHIYSFVLVTAILLLVERWYTHAEQPITIAIALLLGWLVLIRPTNIAFMPFLLLYRLRSWKELSDRLFYIGRQKIAILKSMPFFMMLLIPQFAYWHEMTGNWIHYSYEGEGFIYWCRPKIAAVLFDTQNGLFVYAPVLLLVFAGFIIAPRDKRTSLPGTALLFIMLTYLFGSWWAWWFGAAYGHRSYIEYLPVFAMPVAMVVERVLNLRSAMKKMIVLSAIGCCIVYNIGLTHVFDKSGTMWDGPQWRWNWPLWWSMVRQIV